MNEQQNTPSVWITRIRQYRRRLFSLFRNRACVRRIKNRRPETRGRGRKKLIEPLPVTPKATPWSLAVHMNSSLASRVAGHHQKKRAHCCLSQRPLETTIRAPRRLRTTCRAFQSKAHPQATSAGHPSRAASLSLFLRPSHCYCLPPATTPRHHRGRTDSKARHTGTRSDLT